MYRTILVPLDGSPLSEQALAPAVAICRRGGGRLHIVHVRTMTRPPDAAADEIDNAAGYVQDVCKRVADDLAESVSFALLPEELPRLLMATPPPGTIAGRIAEYADHNGVDLIVMATHGRGGLSRAWFGSVTEALLRTVDLPLFLLRPVETADLTRWRGPQPLRRILVPLDWTPMSQVALEPARELARAFAASIMLLRVVPLPLPIYDAVMAMPIGPRAEDLEQLRNTAAEKLNESAELLRKEGLAVATATVLDSMPARAILDFAREQHMDLIVLATRIRSGLDRILLGSVADKVIRATEWPVLVVRARETEQPDSQD